MKTMCRADVKPPYGLALLACLQNSLVGGIVYGWASIDRTLLTASPSNGGVGLTVQETAVIFSWASCVGMLATLVLGIVLDHLGPRKCSIVSHLFVGAGCLFFVASKATLGTCLIAFGGPGIQFSIVHIANLFPENEFLVLSALNGTISFSFLVFAAFDYLWEHYLWSSEQLFGGFVCVVVLSMVASFVYWPDEPFEARSKDFESLDESFEDELLEAATEHHHLTEQPLDSYLREYDGPHLERHDSFLISKKAIAEGKSRYVSLKDQPFHRQVTSGTYLRSLSVFLSVCFLANFYVCSFSTEMTDFAEFPPSEQHELARLFTVTMSLGVTASLTVGWLMDRIGVEACTVLTLVLGELHLIVLTLLSDHRSWMIVGFWVYIFFRQFLFPVFIASITSRLGFKYFGLLTGIGFALSGVCQAFMSSLMDVVAGNCHDGSVQEDCHHGYWKKLHIVEFLLLGILMLAPFIDYLDRSTREKRAKKWFYANEASENPDASRHSTVSSIGGGYGSLAPIQENQQLDPVGMDIV